MLPPDIAEAIVQLDLASTSWSDADRLAWRLVRGHVRRQHRASQTQLPAVSTAAQEMVLTRNHAQRAIDAMTGVFGQTPPSSDDEGENR